MSDCVAFFKQTLGCVRCYVSVRKKRLTFFFSSLNMLLLLLSVGWVPYYFLVLFGQLASKICCCTCNGHLSVKGFKVRLYIAEGTVIKSVRPPRYEVTESVARLLAVASRVVACRPTLVRSKGGYTGGASSKWNEPRPTDNIISLIRTQKTPTTKQGNDARPR